MHKRNIRKPRPDIRPVVYSTSTVTARQQRTRVAGIHKVAKATVGAK